MPILVPDAESLITLAYAGRLDLLQRPGWLVHAVDMVLHEVTHKQAPTSEAIAAFVREQALTVVTTEVWRRYQQRLVDTATGSGVPLRKAGLGELAIQEYMTRLGLEEPIVPAVFLLKDHKIVRASFHCPTACTQSPPELTSIFWRKGAGLPRRRRSSTTLFRMAAAFLEFAFHNPPTYP